MYMSVKGVDFDSVFTNFRLDLETVPTVWFYFIFFFFFILLLIFIGFFEMTNIRALGWRV
jgi:hypothetical protein